MMGDHGTLTHPNGEPKAYRVLHPTLPDISLMESSVWPDDLTDWQAPRYAADVERRATARLGLVPCDGDHSECAPDENGWHAFICVYCGASL